MSTEIESAVILQMLPGIGATSSTRLWEHFGSFTLVLNAPDADIPPAYQRILQQYRARADEYLIRARQIVEFCTANDVFIVTADNKDYPSLLKEADSSPTILYVKGNINALSLPQIAIVGSRQHTAAGEANALAFARTLSGCGFVVTSGMALGIDAAAHRGAMQNGTTIAVLGTGIDVIYPRRHSDLYGSIIAGGGAVVSEFPPGTPARAGNFPRRNRIISGLSMGVLVVEAALKSGSLITARLAMEQGREVFAVPGSIHNPVSKGCHQLLREGATLTETAQDIVAQLGGMLSFAADELDHQQQKGKVKLDGIETRVLADLGYDFIDLDTLISRSGLSVAELTATLTRLELQGLVENRSGLYCRLS